MKSQKLKCVATPELVKEHSDTLKELDKRTIRIETAAYTTIALITLFGIVIGFIEYGKKKPEATAKITESISVATSKVKHNPEQ